MNADDIFGSPGRVNRPDTPRSNKSPRVRAIVDTLCRIADGTEADPAGAAKKALGPYLHTKPQPGGKAPGGISKPSNDPRFAGIENLDKERYLLRNAETFADRLEMDDAHLDFIYHASRHVPSLSRQAWEKEVRIAHAVEHILETFFPGMRRGQFDLLVNQKTADEAFGKLKGPRGTVVMTYHGGFLKLAMKLFAKRFFADKRPDVYLFNLSSDPSDGLFTALRAIQRGGIAFMAPDGPRGTNSTPLTILGKTFQAGDGPAFLAHTAGSNTAWYTVIRKDDGFIPIIEPGPQRLPNEPFRDFKDRLYGFYAGKIEDAATGDPRNIVFTRRWKQVLRDDASSQ